jgi:hypothetical protein
VIAAANASVVLPKNAARIRAPVKLSRLVAAPLQIVVAKNAQEATTKQGRVPTTRAVGIQKKFYN